MNKVFLTGNLTRDVDLRQTTTTSVARVSAAVNRPFSKDKVVDFLNLVAFGKTAEFLDKYFSKGSRIIVEGRLQTGSYEKDGVKHNTVDVIVEQIEFGDSKKKSKDYFDGEPVPDEDTPF